MQFSGRRDAGTSQDNGNSQAAEGRDDALVAVMEDDAPAAPSPATATHSQPSDFARSRTTKTRSSEVGDAGGRSYRTYGRSAALSDPGAHSRSWYENRGGQPMQFSGSDHEGTSRETEDSQVDEGQNDAMLAVLELETPAISDATKHKVRSTDHPEVFTVDLLGSWFKP